MNGSRRQRIAKGAGVSVTDINNMMRQFNETKKQVKKLTSMLDQGTSKRGKKSKKGKKSKRGMSIPGMGGLSMSDIRKMQSFLDK